jgi:hypothetical protein
MTQCANKSVQWSQRIPLPSPTLLRLPRVMFVASLAMPTSPTLPRRIIVSHRLLLRTSPDAVSTPALVAFPGGRAKQTIPRHVIVSHEPSGWHHDASSMAPRRRRRSHASQSHLGPKSSSSPRHRSPSTSHWCLPTAMRLTPWRPSHDRYRHRCLEPQQHTQEAFLLLVLRKNKMIFTKLPLNP